MHKFMTIVCAGILTVGASIAAFAHAELQTSVPADNATVKPAPTEVAIDFNEELNPKLSKIEVKDSMGMTVDKGDSHVAADDAKHLSVSLQAISAGIYTVAWTSVAADDGHKLTGTFSFTVAQ